MATTETDQKLWNDPLWCALQACIERIEDEPCKVLFEKKADYEGGLDSDTINRLSDATIFSFGSDDDTRTVRVHHPELPVSVCITWLTWHRHGLRDELSAAKLARTVEYLRAWQANRGLSLIDPLATSSSKNRHGADPTVDLTAYVSLSKLMETRTEYKTLASCGKFLDNHKGEIRQRHPSKNRRLVHAGDWHRYWEKHDKQQFESLGDEYIDEMLADREARKAAERHRRKTGN